MARGPLLLVVGAIALSFIAACERERAVFVLHETSSEDADTGAIQIGAFGTLTGEHAREGQHVQRGFALAIDLANAKGGVRGRLVDVVLYDDQGRVEGDRAACDRLSRADKAVVIVSAVDAARTSTAREAAGDVPIVCATCGDGVAQGVLAVGARVASSEFTAGWRARYAKDEPDDLAARGFEAGRFVLEGLARAKTYRPEDVRAALASLRASERK